MNRNIGKVSVAGMDLFEQTKEGCSISVRSVRGWCVQTCCCTRNCAKARFAGRLNSDEFCNKSSFEFTWFDRIDSNICISILSRRV